VRPAFSTRATITANSRTTDRNAVWPSSTRSFRRVSLRSFGRSANTAAALATKLDTDRCSRAAISRSFWASRSSRFAETVTAAMLISIRNDSFLYEGLAATNARQSKYPLPKSYQTIRIKGAGFGWNRSSMALTRLEIPPRPPFQLRRIPRQSCFPTWRASVKVDRPPLGFKNVVAEPRDQEILMEAQKPDEPRSRSRLIASGATEALESREVPIYRAFPYAPAPRN
jgi:hypothetical protein